MLSDLWRRASRRESVPDEPRPRARIVHVGTYMYGGGAEVWLGTLAGLLRSGPVRIEKSLVLGRRYFDRRFAASLPLEVKVVRERSFAQEIRGADLLLSWGPVPLDRLLDRMAPELRPKRVVFVAHSPFAGPSLALGRRHVHHVLGVANHLRSLADPSHEWSLLAPFSDPERVRAIRTREEVRARLGFAPDDFVTGFVGSLVEYKRPDALVEALSPLPASFKALVIGDGPRRACLERRGGARARFARVTRDIGDYYAAMDAVCLPSRTEGFSLVSLEAIQAAKPLLITPHGDVPLYFRHRENAWLLDEGRLAESLREGVLRLSADPAERARIASGGKDLGRRLGSAEAHVRGFVEFVSRALELDPEIR